MNAGRFTTRWGRRQSSATEAQLIQRLRDLPGPVPETRFKSELRAQLVAITARIVSESEPVAAASAPAAVGRSPAGGRALRTLRRPVLAMAGASTVLALLLGMAVWMAGGSLPGQSLYGVKRASENVQLSIAGNDTAKGQAYLQLAGNRVREISDLLSQPSAMLATGGGVHADGRRISPRTASLIADTLASADDDTVNGTQLLTRAAVAQLSSAPLAKLNHWLPDQRRRMTEVRDRIPAGALHTRVQASVLLLQRIATRAAQLTSSMGCPCLTQTLADELGPLPCTHCGPVTTPKPGRGSSRPAPIPGLSSTGTSGSLPTLPPLGGSGTSSSGHAAGPAASFRTSGPALPAVLPATPPPPVVKPAPGGGPASSPAGIGIPPLPTVLGSTPPHLPTTLPVPLPSVSFP
jgi:hypothetical protein